MSEDTHGEILVNTIAVAIGKIGENWFQGPYIVKVEDMRMGEDRKLAVLQLGEYLVHVALYSGCKPPNANTSTD